MAKRSKPGEPDPDAVHEEMLRHLEGHPPPRPRRKSVPTPKPDPAPRPALMLRQLRLVTALHRLETFVAQNRRKSTLEVLVIVGRGLRSGAAGPVIAPAVQKWCDDHPDQVANWNFAPPADGGPGALLLKLRPPSP